jgi:hypothetical protein
MDEIVQRATQVLQTTHVRWLTISQAVEVSLLRLPPAPGEWSAVECLLHLGEAEREVFPVRLQRFLAGRDFDAFNPDERARPEAASLEPRALSAEFAQLRAGSLRLLSGVGAADLRRTALHPELGSVTLDQMINEWAAHDLMHTVQAERALMQPFIAGCGPWREYFLDHVVTS